MALNKIWSDSILGRCSAAFSLAVDRSSLVNWYRGSENFHNVTLLKSSLLYKLVVLKGKVLAWLVNGLGKVVRPLVRPSGAARVITGLNTSLLEQPVRLVSLFGLGLLVTNTAVKLATVAHPSLRSLVLRGAIILLLIMGTTIRASWKQLISGSVVARAVENIIWGD